MDPGLIFYFGEAQDIHACLALPSTTNVFPPLQQGKKKILVKVFIFTK